MAKTIFVVGWLLAAHLFAQDCTPRIHFGVCGSCSFPFCSSPFTPKKLYYDEAALPWDSVDWTTRRCAIGEVCTAYKYCGADCTEHTITVSGLCKGVQYTFRSTSCCTPAT